MINVTHLPILHKPYSLFHKPSLITPTRICSPEASLMRQRHNKSQQHQQDQKRYFPQRCSRALCCTCRLSVSSEPESISAGSSASSERFAAVSTLAHAMVQERLDQMIKERRDQAKAERPSSSSSRRQKAPSEARFVLMVAVEKSSDDPREDFRESMVEMITANRIEEPRDLRSLLNYYVSMNSDEYHGVILEVFHEVCSILFLYSCKARY